MPDTVPVITWKLTPRELEVIKNALILMENSYKKARLDKIDPPDLVEVEDSFEGDARRAILFLQNLIERIES